MKYYNICRESIVLKLDQQVSGNLDVNNYVFLLVAASIYYNESSYETALKVLHQSDHLEWYCKLI
jgi:hypothetical protein